MHPLSTSGAASGTFEHGSPSPETARGADRIRFQVAGAAAILCLVALLILGMREVDPIPTPSPLDARTELTTPVPDPVPIQPGRLRNADVVSDQ